MANSTSFRTRFKISAFFFLALFALVLLRLIDLQIIRHDELTKKAEQQYVVTIELEPKRGDIFDRNMKPLATSLKVPSIYAVPKLIRENQKMVLAKILGRILNEQPQSLFKRLKKDKSFAWLKRKADQSTADRIKKLNNPNVSIIHETKRFYPGSSLLAQIVGFCDIDNRGLEGLELHLNSYLEGRAGYRKTKRDARGREVPAMLIKEVPPVNGNNVVLTIDEFIQNVAERELDKAFEKWHPKGAIAIVMNPNTGEILALVSRPTYDLNQIQTAKLDARRNRGITDIFEPGSIFKIVTAASAYNEGVVKTTDTFFCENGEWYYKYHRVIHDVHPYGKLTFPQVIEKSSNIGTVKIALKLGQQKLYQYIKQFGFGDPTGVDFPGEVSGIVHPLNKWSGISITSVPYGQEVAATAIQMLTALNVVANGGNLMKPYIVQSIQDEHDVVIQKNEPVIKRRVITQDTAKVISQILTQVVESGTGTAAQIEGVKVAGKTGTSQKLLPGGGYSHSNFIGSFLGFAPVDKPLFSMIVVLDDPHPAYYGGTVAAPVFNAVAQEILPYLGYVWPKETESTKTKKKTVQ